MISTDRIIREARALGVAPGMLCTTCGRVSGGSEHFGHTVTRIDPAILARPVAPRARKVVEWLTVAEVAALLRVSKMTVYRLTHLGEIDSVRIGRSIRIKADDVHAYVDRDDQDDELPLPVDKAELVRANTWGVGA